MKQFLFYLEKIKIWTPMLVEFLKFSGLLIAFLVSFILLGVSIKNSIEYIETNPFASEKISRNLISLFIFAHFYLLYINLSRLLIISSLVAHICFFSFYSEYPILKIRNSRFIFGLFLTLLNHICLIIEFGKGYLNGLNILICFIILWITPFTVFFNISANQDTAALEARKRKTSIVLGRAVEWLQSFQSKSIKN